MGHAWCKEKSTKAQDSKSPIDRVFVRCAHRIYPSLKEEGSVLGCGGSTAHRVTSSEIGYTLPTLDGAPPRSSKLQRGHSIDSVDRPFHPSEWVDVNLEVPCTPRYSLGHSNSKQWTARLHNSSPPDSFDENGQPMKNWETEEKGIPVPPPRRRRRRSQRVRLPGEAADDESEPEPELLTSLGSANCSNATLDNVDGPNDSDDEFVEIEKSLLREEVSEKSTEPKNHSTTSLPNAVESESERIDEGSEEVAKRPPRQKTSSLPRDVSLLEPKGEKLNRESPERTWTARRKSTSSHHSLEEDLQENCPPDNSIFKIDTSKEKVEEDDDIPFDVKTSTPVKIATSSAPIDEDGAVLTAQSLDDAFASFNNHQQLIDASSKSCDLSTENEPVVPIVQNVDRPAPRIEDDGGYESKSSIQAFLDFERSSTEEPSSGILKDAIVSSGDSMQLVNLVDEELLGLVVIQRTISEESLPHEMLVDELDEDEEQQKTGERKDKSRSQEQNSIAEAEKFETPPPSPETKKRESSNEIVNGFVDVAKEELDQSKEDECPSKELAAAAATATLSVTSTPSLMAGLEAALADIIEKKEESEPQIVPLKRLLPFEDIAELEEEQPQQQSQPIGFPRLERTNPFIDSTRVHHEYNVDEPPEKPKRVERTSSCLIDESVIEEPLIVPTPPRRRNRSKSNLNSSAEPEALHTYASRDRLI